MVVLYVVGVVVLIIFVVFELVGEVEQIEMILEEMVVFIYVDQDCDSYLGFVSLNVVMGYGKIDVLVVVEWVQEVVGMEELIVVCW